MVVQSRFFPCVDYNFKQLKLGTEKGGTMNVATAEMASAASREETGANPTSEEIMTWQANCFS